mmetsp:Transcript_7853/g.18182  ORF Transcript_7853/g.18182 Transcript_7853/m.18182 type:complete len:212 (+) Transcript_7853:880-1515(+)
MPQVGSLDLRRVVVIQLMLVGPLREQTEAFARLDSPSAPGALIRRGLGARDDDQGLHSCPRVEGVLLAKARVNHVDNVVNGDGGLRNVRRKNDLSRAVWRLLEDFGLHVRGKIGINGQDEQLSHVGAHAAGLEAEEVHRLLDLLLTSEEDKHVARPLGEVDLQHCDDTGVQIISFWRFGVVNADWIAAPRNVEDRCVIKVLGELLCIEGGR